MSVTKSFFVPSSVLYLTLGRSLTTWPQTSRTTPSPTSSRPPTPPASPSTNLKPLCPVWPSSPLPPTWPPTLQIPTLPPTWPLAPEEAPQGWWPTQLEDTPTSNPRTQDRSCCSRQVIMVSHWNEILFIYGAAWIRQSRGFCVKVRTWSQQNIEM